MLNKFCKNQKFKTTRILKVSLLVLMLLMSPIVVHSETNVEDEEIPATDTLEESIEEETMKEITENSMELENDNDEIKEAPSRIQTFSTTIASEEPEFGNFTGNGAGTLDVYTSETSTSASTYISNHGAYNGVVPILQKGKNRHKIAIAGVIGWVDNNYLKAIPFSKAKSYNYYTINSNGEFVHYISTNAEQISYSGALHQGGIPENVKVGQNYLSFDGNYFYPATSNGLQTLIANYNNGNRDGSINRNKPFYNYFQYLPVRTQTNLTKDDFRNYFPSSYRSPQASRMWDMEQLFIDHSNHQGTNAALVFSTGVHESAFGGSYFALQRNNFFGHEAYDSSPGSATAYASPGIGISLHSGRLIKWNYSDVKSSLFNGGVLGNKTIGMNVKYASDPYWGEKIANHYYLMDKKAGFKDLNQYTIGLINSNNVNIRKEANTNSGIVYTNNKKGIPIAIIEEKNGEKINNNVKWYGFVSESQLDNNKNLVKWDSSKRDELRYMRFDLEKSKIYIHSDFVDIISNGKNSKLNPQPKPKLKEHPKFVGDQITVYTLDTVNLRPDWSTDYPAITSIPKDTMLTGAQLTENGWLFLLYNGKYIGYINADYASIKKGGEPIGKPNNSGKHKVGDINGDGVIDVIDAAMMQAHLRNIYTLKSTAFVAADINGDKVIDVIDAAMMQAHLRNIKKIEGW